MRTLVALFFLIGLSNAHALESLQGPAKNCPIKALKDGKEISLASLKGKVVYLDFWASWCGPCALSFPFMEETYLKHKSEGLEVVAISVDETADDASNFINGQKVNFAIAHDPEGTCPKAYELQTMPTSYLIDRKGNLRSVHRGFNNSDREELNKSIDALLKEKP